MLITSGGGGIGSALAAGVAAAGGRFIVADVDEPAAERTAAGLPSAGWAAVDVRRQESVVADVLESAADGAVAGKRSNDDEDATGRPNYLYFAAYGNQAR